MAAALAKNRFAMCQITINFDEILEIDRPFVVSLNQEFLR